MNVLINILYNFQEKMYLPVARFDLKVDSFLSLE